MMQRRVRLLRLRGWRPRLALACSIVALTACPKFGDGAGDDSDEDEDEPIGGSAGSGIRVIPTGTGGTSGSGGTGGTSNSAGSGGSAGSAGTASSGGTGNVSGGTDYASSELWRGYMYELADPTSTIERDGACAVGAVTPHPNFENFALWGWNITQETSGAFQSPWTPGLNDALEYAISNLGGSALRLQLIAESGAFWCYELSEPIGRAPLSQFNSQCWDDSGASYAREPLRAVQLLVPSGNLRTVAFEFCVEALGPVDDPSL